MVRVFPLPRRPPPAPGRRRCWLLHIGPHSEPEHNRSCFEHSISASGRPEPLTQPAPAFRLPAVKAQSVVRRRFIEIAKSPPAAAGTGPRHSLHPVSEAALCGASVLNVTQLPLSLVCQGVPMPEQQEQFQKSVLQVLEAVMFENWLRFYFIIEKPDAPADENGEKPLLLAVPRRAWSGSRNIIRICCPWLRK